MLGYVIPVQKLQLRNKYARRGAMRNGPQQLIMFGRCVMLTRGLESSAGESVGGGG